MLHVHVYNWLYYYSCNLQQLHVHVLLTHSRAALSYFVCVCPQVTISSHIKIISKSWHFFQICSLKSFLILVLVISYIFYMYVALVQEFVELLLVLLSCLVTAWYKLLLWFHLRCSVTNIWSICWWDQQ